MTLIMLLNDQMNGNFLLVLVNANKHMQVGNSPFVAYNLMD